jgi:hypothetical protein
MERSMHVTDKSRGMHVSENDGWRSAAEAPAGAANDLTRRTREQAGAAAEQLYQKGARASEYMTENVRTYPITALIVAGLIGYAMAYLIHAPSQAHRRERERYRLYDPDKMRRDRVPHSGEVIGRDVPDESKERHTEIAVGAGRTIGESRYRR